MYTKMTEESAYLIPAREKKTAFPQDAISSSIFIHILNYKSFSWIVQHTPNLYVFDLDISYFLLSPNGDNLYLSYLIFSF